MKKHILIITAAVMLLSLAACSTGRENDETTQQPQTVSTELVKTDRVEAAQAGGMPTKAAPTTAAVPAAAGSASQSSASSILIAYFTWGDNTVVEHPENVDIDASTSASVLVPGNVAMMASWIQEETGGDLFSIQVAEPYSSDYDECLERASEEKAQNARPALVSHVENMDQYDTIFLGYPNWWYTVPMALHSFIEEYDLAGKKIVLFCSHGTGGLARSVQDIEAALPDSCEVEENVIGVYRNDIPGAKPRVQEWLNEIGY